MEGGVELMLSRMTLDQKVGQLFVISFEGTTFSPELEYAVQDLHVGGVLLFAANVSSLSELRSVVEQAQEASLASGAQIPLFIGIDHEGGIITRLKDRATEFPSNMAVGAARSVGDARMMADAMAAELQAMGVNMTLGPVLDVNTDPANPIIGTRSFGSDPSLVTRMGLAMIERYQGQGMIAVAKHFPGHGHTSIDSHISLPKLDADRRRLDAVELRPFRAAVAAEVDAIMTAHMAVPVLDPSSTPATLSAPVLTELLRQEWGFDGLIATDSLGMGAIDEAYGMREASVLAFQAGADLQLFGWDTVHALPEIYAAYDALLDLVQRDPDSAARLDNAVRRILRTKARRGILDWPPPSPSITNTVRTPDHLQLARRIARNSVTLVRDDAQILPLKPETRLLVVYPQRVPQVEAALRTCFENLEALSVRRNPEDSEIAKALEKAAEAEVVVVATLNAMEFPNQVTIVRALAEQTAPIVVVALRSPYDLLTFPEQSTYVAIYGETAPSLEAMADLLCGRIKPKGLLPVDLPGLHPFGHGLGQFSNPSAAGTPPAASSALERPPRARRQSLR
jgi:beta-N-acetylhexosaminidase